MAKHQIAGGKHQVYQEAFLARLNQRLAAPTSECSTVRCWTDSSLKKLFKQIRDDLATENLSSSLSHAALLEWLRRLRLATPLPVENESMYLLDFGESAESDVEPSELLMAAKPSGVICYFSAVAFHELTTQHVAHHHVAELRHDGSAAKAGRLDDIVVDRPEKPSRKTSQQPRRLGKLLFHFQGIPYYSTRRSARLVPGVQTRGYGPRTRVRITTLEQTLLDTLYKPFHCGGPEIVFEAWRAGVASRNIDEERLVAHLRVMNYLATTRRLAVMLTLMDFSPGAELRQFLDASQEAIDRKSPFARISLLPGVDYQSVNERWLVNTP